MGHLRLGGWGKAPQDFTKFSMFELLAINQKFDETFLSKSLKAFYNKQAIQNCTNKKNHATSYTFGKVSYYTGVKLW